MAVRAGARRERVRAATVEEIKQTALGLMREQGTTNIRFTDIARAMGMTPPALYRYFADRDELLTALITDGYADLGRAIAEAGAEAPSGDVAGRYLAGAQAYRRWALADPQRFALILGTPVPGYVAPTEGQTTEAAQAAMGQLVSLFVEAQERGELRPPTMGDVDEVIHACALASNKAAAVVLPPDSFQAMLHGWAALHGFVSLEVNGHFHWLPAEARDALFSAQLKLIARTAGLPEPGGDGGGPGHHPDA